MRNLRMMAERYLSWVLFPRFPIYLHWHRIVKRNFHFFGLAHSVRLAQANLSIY